MPKKLGIGARLRSERRRVDLSQKELADRMGIGRNTQINYEKELHMPTADYLAGLEAHGLDACYILLGRRTKPV